MRLTAVMRGLVGELKDVNVSQVEGPKKGLRLFEVGTGIEYVRKRHDHPSPEIRASRRRQRPRGDQYYVLAGMVACPRHRGVRSSMRRSIRP